MASGMQFDMKQFHSSMGLYVKVSKRDFAYIVNKRAINIAFKAMKKTKAATAKKVRADLLRKAKVPGRRGKQRPSMAALIVNKKEAGKGLYGAAMKEKIRELIKLRTRTIAYIKSGFLGVIRHIEAKVPGRAKRRPNNVSKFSRNPGKGKAALPVIRAQALIMNFAKDSAKVAGKAVQAAINSDASDMATFARRRLRKSWKKLGAI